MVVQVRYRPMLNPLPLLTGLPLSQPWNSSRRLPGNYCTVVIWRRVVSGVLLP